jgi:hypothetical protein
MGTVAQHNIYESFSRMLNCVRCVPAVRHNETGTAERETRDVIQIILFHGAENFENQMHLHRVTQTQVTSRGISCVESVKLLYGPYSCPLWLSSVLQQIVSSVL